MGLKEIIQEQLQRRREKKDYEESRKVEEQYRQKKMSANERELISHYHKEREKIMAKELEIIRKQEQKSFMSGRENNIGYAKQVVKDDNKLFQHKNIFVQPSIFKK